MNDKDKIEHILYNLMFAKPHQISNAEDAYIEYEVRLSKEDYLYEKNRWYSFM